MLNHDDADMVKMAYSQETNIRMTQHTHTRGVFREVPSSEGKTKKDCNTLECSKAS